MCAEIKAVSASGICDIRDINNLRENSIREYASRGISDVVFDLNLLVDWDARRTLAADYPDFIGEVLFSFEPEWGFEFHESLREAGWSIERALESFSEHHGPAVTWLYRLYFERFERGFAGERADACGQAREFVFPQYLQDEYCFLTNGFDEIALQPHSRIAGVNIDDIAADKRLQILTCGPESGPGLVATRDFSEVFALGHWEYSKMTLAQEYERDMAKGLSNVPFPHNYFPNDDANLEPLFSWRAHANLLWRNWLNWVYETTPYKLSDIPQLRATGKLGTDRSIRHEPASPRTDNFIPFSNMKYGMHE